MSFFFGPTHEPLSGSHLFWLGLVFYLILIVIRVSRLTDEKQKRLDAFALRNTALGMLFITGALLVFNMFYPICFAPFALTCMGIAIINLLAYWYLQRQ